MKFICIPSALTFVGLLDFFLLCLYEFVLVHAVFFLQSLTILMEHEEEEKIIGEYFYICNLKSTWQDWKIGKITLVIKLD